MLRGTRRAGTSTPICYARGIFDQEESLIEKDVRKPACKNISVHFTHVGAMACLAHFRRNPYTGQVGRPIPYEKSPHPRCADPPPFGGGHN